MNFTKNALNQFKKLIAENENPTAGIRFYTTQGCCSPILQMDIVEKQSQADMVLQIDDVSIFLSSEAEQILSEITLDYSDSRFRSVNSPN